MPLLKTFNDKDGNRGGQKKSDDLRTMTTIGQRTLVFYKYIGSVFEAENTSQRAVRQC